VKNGAGFLRGGARARAPQDGVVRGIRSIERDGVASATADALVESSLLQASHKSCMSHV
jgi:hypothetical protein